MNEESKKLIEEMKGVVLDMFRSAADLDQWIQQLESELGKDDNDSDYQRIYVNTISGYREHIKYGRRYNSLDAREASIWERLKIEIQRDSENEETGA